MLALALACSPPLKQFKAQPSYAQTPIPYNVPNCFQGGDLVLPKTQSRIFAFIIRESQLYLSFAEHKTRRKLRFAQSQFRRPAHLLFLSLGALAELLLKKIHRRLHNGSVGPCFQL